MSVGGKTLTDKVLTTREKNVSATNGSTQFPYV
jgi:hypothetical protein